MTVPRVPADKVVTRVCIISPGHMATNPRLVKEADALANAGLDVSVIVADFVQWAAEEDERFGPRNWRVAKRLVFGPRAPLGRRMKLGLRQRLARRALGWGLSSQRLLECAAHQLAEEMKTAAMNTPADLYIAHYVAALPAAAAAAQQNNACYAYDAEDYHLGEWPAGPEFDVDRRIVRGIEGRYIAGCRFVSAASPMIAEALVEAYGVAPPQVILNVFPRSQAPGAPTSRGCAEPGPSLYWFSQTIGPGRGLECAVRALGMTSCRPHLYLRGKPADGFISKLERLAGEAGVPGHVHILPPASPDKMESLAAHYDLGIASEVPVSRNRDICLTNKLFSFLLAGLPPLLSATEAQERFADEVGLSRLVYPTDDPVALAALVDRLLSDPDELAALRRRVWSLGQERYNWDCEQQKSQLLALSATLAVSVK